MPKRKRQCQSTTQVEPSVEACEHAAKERSLNKAQIEPEICTFTVTFQKSANKPPQQIPCEIYRHGHSCNRPSLIFTHGAGGTISSPAVRDFAVGFVSRSIITTFQGNLNLQSRTRMFLANLDHHGKGTSIALGGRSMGARAAVLAAQDRAHQIKTLVLVSYPLTAAGKQREPDRREKILLDLAEDVDVLFIVGNRDVQCNLKDLKSLRGEMRAKSWLMVVNGADHGMRLTGADDDGRKTRSESGRLAAEWCESREEGKRFREMTWDVDNGVPMIEDWQSENEKLASRIEKAK